MGERYKKAKSIMIQGTMSNAGKSIIAAALCRIFKQDGYSVCPFKSQNMALNSFITSEGLEIGRAQAMQSQAAKTEPLAAMNPILLKPTSDTGSQVIVNGKAVGNMSAREYFARKKEFVPIIKSSFDMLCDMYDIVVIEGAGSPVELNLKSGDIVNMGMAKMANSPVLLVGDIDRGGVFAQLLGTLMLLEDDERSLVKGLVVNKFRGDISFFGDGVKILESKGGVRVAGVVPYVNCDIDDEDSLSERLGNSVSAFIDIAVIKLPKISNFTDFNVFSAYENVSVRYVSAVNELKTPDLVIIPGTKSTISDLLFMRESGLEAAVKKLYASGTAVVGICGGYQIMGKRISDKRGVEGGGTVDGMGILDTETEFSAEKTTVQTSGEFAQIGGFFSALSGGRFSGYEIHHGVSAVNGKPLVQLENGGFDGAFTENAMGTYVHGIFDSPDISERLVKALYRKKGAEYTGKAVSREEYMDIQYNKLAAEVRKSIDMEFVYRILEEGV